MSDYDVHGPSLSGSDVTHGGAESRAVPRSRLHDYLVAGGPLWIDRQSGNQNALYSFKVRAATQESAAQIARNTINDPIGTAIDSRVTVQVYLKVVENAASASVVGISRDQFSRFDIDVNGIDGYATLEDGAAQAQMLPDLWVVDAPVSFLDINGYGAWNRLLVHSLHGGNNVVQDVEVGMIHEE